MPCGKPLAFRRAPAKHWRLRRVGKASRMIQSHGKPEAFRKERGKAAECPITDALVYEFHTMHRARQPPAIYQFSLLVLQ